MLFYDLFEALNKDFAQICSATACSSQLEGFSISPKPKRTSAKPAVRLLTMTALEAAESVNDEDDCSLNLQNAATEHLRISYGNHSISTCWLAHSFIAASNSDQGLNCYGGAPH
jgi:hypothetical protein